MTFNKGNEIGKATRFQPGESGNPAGRPRDLLKHRIEDELDQIHTEATDSRDAATKLQVLAERIVDDAIEGCAQSRRLLVDRIYPALSKHEVTGADGGPIQLQTEMHNAAEEFREMIEAKVARFEALPRCTACGSPVRDGDGPGSLIDRAVSAGVELLAAEVAPGSSDEIP